MKRMNLLPPELRPRGGRHPGSSYIVVGALAAAILAMVAYGAVIRGVRSDETRLAGLTAETEHAQAQADALSPYARFADMKQTRAQSVRGVAAGRFDYERLTRQLARVLPHGVSVSNLDVAPDSPSDADVAKGADSPDAAVDGPPAMSLSGCAPSQNAVANTLDRLRALTGATAITLGSSGRADGGAPAGGAPYLVEGSGSGGGGCGTGVSFDAQVKLSAPEAPVQTVAGS